MSSSIEPIKKALTIYWPDLQTLVKTPKVFFLKRKPLTDQPHIVYKVCAIRILVPVLIFAVLDGTIRHSIVIGLIDLLAGYLFFYLLGYLQKYILWAFEEKKTFLECLDLVACMAPAFVLAWIPAYGIPISVLIIGYWSYLGLSCQFKMNQHAALAAAGLPVVLTGGALLAVTFIGAWVSAAFSLMGHV